MVGISHGEAVSILKSTQGKVHLQVEKGAMQFMGIATSPEPLDPPIQPESQPDGTNAFSVDVQVRKCICVCGYVSVCMYLCMFSCLYVVHACMCMYVFMLVRACMCMDKN